MATQDSRIRIKRSTINGEVPTVAPSTDHTDGTWSATDIYEGEVFLNMKDGLAWFRATNGIVQIGGGVNQATITVAAADVLLMFATPQPFGLTVPAGFAAQIISASFVAVFNSVAYATNTNIHLGVGYGYDAQAKGTGYLGFNTDTLCAFNIETGAANSLMLADGSDLLAYEPSAAPTLGNSDIQITITYCLVPV